MNKEREIKNYLKYLAKGGMPENPSDGLCLTINLRFYPISINEGALREWPEYSGTYMFPVPHPKLGPREAYCDIANVWRKGSKYGDARRRLCKWLVEKIERGEFDELFK